MLGARDYYAVLGVTPTSEDVVIQAAYKALMRKYHPDANRDVAMSKWAADFNEAFAVVGRADRRAAYDAQRWEIQQRRGSDRRHADPTNPPQRTATENLEEGDPAKPLPWKSWTMKGAGILLSIAAAKFVTPLIASLGTPAPSLAYRPSDFTSAPAPAIAAPPLRQKGKTAKQMRAASSGLPAVAKADMVRAARRIEHVFGRGGVSAGVAFSRNCHAKAVSGGDWSSFDFCTAFDDAARTADVELAKASGTSPNVYFLGVTSTASQIANYAMLSRDGEVLGKRLRDIRRKVAAHTGGSLPSASVKRSGPSTED